MVAKYIYNALILRHMLMTVCHYKTGVISHHFYLLFDTIDFLQKVYFSGFFFSKNKMTFHSHRLSGMLIFTYSLKTTLSKKINH